jgi:3-(3-hydroxy-phenyl)propionate hydroxylase
MRVAEYTFRAQVADRWRRGNIFLLGDAAHLTPPFIGQGLGAGLRDAFNLSWKLAGVLNGSLTADVLDSYQKERKPHARALIGLALAIGHFMTAGGRPGDALRRLVVPRVRLIPGLASKVLDSTTPRLSRSTCVERPRGRGGLAGMLCPNAVVASDQRLDSVVGKCFSVITRVEPGPQMRRLIEERHAVVVHAGPGTPLADWLGRGHVQVAVVRPDFTVLRSGTKLAEVCGSLPSFG